MYFFLRIVRYKDEIVRCKLAIVKSQNCEGKSWLTFLFFYSVAGKNIIMRYKLRIQRQCLLWDVNLSELQNINSEMQVVNSELLEKSQNSEFIFCDSDYFSRNSDITSHNSDFVFSELRDVKSELWDKRKLWEDGIVRCQLAITKKISEL